MGAFSAVRLAFALLALATAVTTATPARAFVRPGWDSAARLRRATLLGNWRVYASRSEGLIDAAGLTFTISGNTMTAGDATLPYRIVEEDGAMISLIVVGLSGHEARADVLVDDGDHLTIYLQDAAGDDREVYRVERIR